MNEKKLPVIKRRLNNGLSIAVFAENRKRDNGDEYISYSVNVQKSYKDKNDQWQQQNISIFDNNIMELAGGLIGVFNDLCAIKSKETPATATATATATDTDSADANAKAIDDAIAKLDNVPF